DGILGDDVAQERFRPLHIDREVIVDKEHSYRSALGTRAPLQEKEFIDDTLVGSETDCITEKTCHGTEVATVWTTSTGLHGHEIQAVPGRILAFEKGSYRCRELRNQIKLLEIERVPGNSRVVLEAWFDLHPIRRDGRIHFLKISRGGIRNDSRPRIVGFTERD